MPNVILSVIHYDASCFMQTQSYLCQFCTLQLICIFHLQSSILSPVVKYAFEEDLVANKLVCRSKDKTL